MEALTAVAVAALTIYDMCKAVEKGMTITDIYLETKTGGKSGTYKRKKTEVLADVAVRDYDFRRYKPIMKNEDQLQVEQNHGRNRANCWWELMISTRRIDPGLKREINSKGYIRQK